MRIVALFLILNLPLAAEVRGEVCPESGYLLTTQEEVDAFGATGCTEVTGEVWIGLPQGGGNPTPWDISSLLPLSNIERVGSLVIENTRLLSLEGLQNLVAIDKDLWIVANDELSDVSALSNLTRLGGYLTVLATNFAFDFSGLANLQTIEGNGLLNAVSPNNPQFGMSLIGTIFTGWDHSGLESWGLQIVKHGLVLLGVKHLSVLSQLQIVDDLAIKNSAIEDLTQLKHLSISRLALIENWNLLSLDGLQASLALKFLRVSSNGQLASLNGLAPIHEIESLYIDGNPSLENIDALISLTEVKGALFIGCNRIYVSRDPDGCGAGPNDPELAGNPLLVDLDGLAGLTVVGGDVSIVGNRGLININGLANLVSVGNDLPEPTPDVAEVYGNLNISYNVALSSCEALAGVMGWPDGPPSDNVGGTLILEGNALSCSDSGTILDSVSAPVELAKPAAPEITRIESDNEGIQIWVNIADTGGLSVRQFVATCTDGNNTFTGVGFSSPIYVDGLTNGVAYTCTVSATNVLGTGSASAASPLVQPEETSMGLPIWLLYQATQ